MPDIPSAARLRVAAAAALALAACSTSPRRAPEPPPPADGTRAEVAILETTDLHSNILGYDYYKLAPDPGLGFERVATLIEDARREFPNTFLFDDGDTIQGTALADYQAMVKPVACDEELAMYRAMDAIGFDGGTIGNHEFNYGLPFLAQVTGETMDVAGVPERKCKGPSYPLVLANVFSARDGKPIYPPFAVVEKKIAAKTPDGRTIEVPLRIGIIGFTPPPIVEWDKRNLEGKVTVAGVPEAARRFVPALRAEGVDLVVAISHGGIDTRPETPDMENANWYLAEVPGIDVVLLGHSHTVFPAPDDPKSRFNGLPDVDNVRGFIHGKPAVMGNFWGKSLGVVDLALVRRDGRWTIDDAATHSEVRDVKRKDGTFVASDPKIAKIVEPVHQATIAYVSQPIGMTDFPLTTYFVDVGDVSALEPINRAQKDYVERYIAKNLPQYADVPVLSAAAAFKAGFGGANDYTDIPAGPIAIHGAADLYLYPNTLQAVKIDGAGLKAWLERSAQRFNRIDPDRSAPQALINTRTPSYNLDVIEGGVHYVIDVTRPVGSRIEDLSYHGKPVDPRQPFIVVTNNYRASGGGHFPGLDGSNIVVSAPDANRDVLIDWIREHPHLTRAEDGSDRSWRFATVRTKGPVVFTSASGKIDLARSLGLPVRVVSDNGDGTSTYAIDLGAHPRQ